MTYSILVFLLVLVSILLIGIVLLQSGQGDMGSAMGGNTMNQAFGGEGADKLLVRITTTLAAIFMVLAISIQWFGTTEETSRFDESNNTLPAMEKNDESEELNEGIQLPATE
jgi:protein translocase SecG subunit